jgi:hypothetical protein
MVVVSAMQHVDSRRYSKGSKSNIPIDAHVWGHMRAPRAAGARNICAKRRLHESHRTQILHVTNFARNIICVKYDYPSHGTGWLAEHNCDSAVNFIIELNLF